MKITHRQAIEAQNVIGEELLKLNLPMQTSLEIARLSNEIDRQVNAFAKIRNLLTEQYQIKVKAAEQEGMVTLTGEAASVKEYNHKVNELGDALTEDIVSTIHLPADLKIEPTKLKAIAPFVADE